MKSEQALTAALSRVTEGKDMSAREAFCGLGLGEGAVLGEP